MHVILYYIYIVNGFEPNILLASVQPKQPKTKIYFFDSVSKRFVRLGHYNS